MVNFDKFEKRVKEKYGKQEFPFDEQNWEKASKMIDASRQGKNRGGIFLLSAVALLCTTGLVYYFGFSDNAANLTKNTLASNGSTTTNEVVVKSETDTKTPNTNINSNLNTESNTSDVVNTNSESNATKNNSSVSNDNSTNFNRTSSVKGSFSKTKVDEKTEANENNISTSTSEIKSEKNTKTSEPVTTNENKANTNSIDSKPKKAEQIKSNAKTTLPTVLGSNNNQNNVKPITTNPIAAGGNSDKEGEVKPTTEPTKNEPAVTESANSITVVDIIPTQSSVTDSLPSVKTTRADSLKFPPPTGDGISYATNVKMEHNHKNFLFMEAGAAYLLGWTGNNGNDADGFNLVVGLNFQHYFSNIFSAQIGVQYNSIGNMTQTSHTISTVNYDLGIEKDITSIKYQKLHYVVAPIKLAVNAGKDNILGIGCNVAYLLNSESKNEKYKTYSNDPKAVKNNLTSTKETGYVQGFNPIDVQVSAFYRRKIYKGLSVNAEFIFGLTDTKSNTFFKSSTFERTTGFKLTLCYDLFKK